MTDLARELSRVRDRIRPMLKEESGLGAVGSAALRARAAGTSFGEQLQAIKTNNIGKAKAEYDLLRQQQQDEAAAAKTAFDQAQKLAERGNADAKAVIDAVNSVVPEEDRATVFNSMHEDPETITPLNAAEVAARHFESLKQEGKAGLGEPYTLSPGSQRRQGDKIIAEAPTKPTKPNPVNVIYPDKTTEIIDKNDPEAIARANAKGGKLFGLGVNAATMGGLTGARADDAKREIQSADDAIQTIDGLITRIKEKPASAGITSEIRGAAQKAKTVYADIARWAKDALGVDIYYGDEGDPEIDPNLIDLGILEGKLAYKLARARKGSGRLNRDDVDNARKAVKLQGFNASSEVVERLRAIQDEFARAKEDNAVRLTGEEVPPEESDAPPPSITDPTVKELWPLMPPEDRKLFLE